ncbi:MerR family DNA-binding transcriptional regulator [Palleronia caenipelagi]|uniref:MerR family DNA-binding transcriptional regulator n=1 Tax=Palleronia caenipelagi TaxID=2489174 RepID=A0A547PJH5_9RHOB|nr:MerR family DNA-binding transcriptional regulator [Palleronia caenipelagi]TRD14283.1 MerR family DNA-binding transcriptional regulator [Palleronia caenipelagi]
MPKHTRLTGIKRCHSYTVDEAAQVCGVTARTIRNWEKEGLRVMNCARPALIRGDDLRAHIKSQREGRKAPLGIETFYCLRCRKARAAAGGMADCTITGPRATLSALCALRSALCALRSARSAKAWSQNPSPCLAARSLNASSI